MNFLRRAGSIVSKQSIKTALPTVAYTNKRFYSEEVEEKVEEKVEEEKNEFTAEIEFDDEEKWIPRIIVGSIAIGAFVYWKKKRNDKYYAEKAKREAEEKAEENKEIEV